MRYDEFLAKVRDRGEYADNDEARRVTETVLALLGERLSGGEAKDLASQLPGELQEVLLKAPQEAEGYGVQEFLRRAAERLTATEQTALWDTSAVLSTVAEAISGGELNNVLTQLQAGYAGLFGKPELT